MLDGMSTYLLSKVQCVMLHNLEIMLRKRLRQHVCFIKLTALQVVTYLQPTIHWIECYEIQLATIGQNGENLRQINTKSKIMKI